MSDVALPPHGQLDPRPAAERLLDEVVMWKDLAGKLHCGTVGCAIAMKWPSLALKYSLAPIEYKEPEKLYAPD